MSVFEDLYFNSSRGDNLNRARLCIPEGTPRAVLQISHGIAEYIDRYDDFMQFLAENGIAAIGEDHLGHGKSVHSDADLGFFAEKNGWNYVVEDMKILHDTAKKKFPGVPFIAFGHSMGSFLTRTYIIKYPDDFDYVILSGTGHQSAGLIGFALALSNVLTKVNGPRSRGDALNNIAFGSYCSKIENPRTPFDWLSRNEANVDKYIADPMCGFVATTSLYRDMMSGIKFIINDKNIAKMNKDVPVYFMSGADDPVGDYGDGVNKAYDAFCKAGLKDIKIKLYPSGRHEMLNETNAPEVYSDILAWINEKL